MNHHYFIYMLTNRKDGVIYIGVTNDLLKRVHEHKEKIVEGFTKKYNLDKLVYFEQTDNLNSARDRERVLKSWRRDWKVKLIEKNNSEWKDLYLDLIDN